MRVISRYELKDRSTRELAALYAWVFDDMLRLRHGSPEWQAGMLSLENIRREQAARKTRPRPPGL